MIWKVSFWILILFSISNFSLRAETVTGQMHVTAVIDPVCSINVNDLHFGSYDPNTSSPHITQTDIIIYCSNNLGYTISFDKGMGPEASLTQRKMTSGEHFLSYNLFTNNSLNTVLGDALNSESTTISGTGIGATLPVTHTIYGAIFPGQQKPAGIYSDTITVTVTY
jgi:spore coat protein U-like protein